LTRSKYVIGLPAGEVVGKEGEDEDEDEEEEATMPLIEDAVVVAYLNPSVCKLLALTLCWSVFVVVN